LNLSNARAVFVFLTFFVLGRFSIVGFFRSKNVFLHARGASLGETLV